MAWRIYKREKQSQSYEGEAESWARGVNGWKKTWRFCKEPKTFSQDILLILNRSVSASRLLSFAPSRSRFFFLNCRLPPSSAHPRTPRSHRAFPLSRNLCVSSPVLSFVHYIPTMYLSRLLSILSKEREHRIGKGRANVATRARMINITTDPFA